MESPSPSIDSEKKSFRNCCRLQYTAIAIANVITFLYDWYCPLLCSTISHLTVRNAVLKTYIHFIVGCFTIFLKIKTEYSKKRRWNLLNFTNDATDTPTLIFWLCSSVSASRPVVRQPTTIIKTGYGCTYKNFACNIKMVHSAERYGGNSMTNVSTNQNCKVEDKDNRTSASVKPIDNHFVYLLVSLNR